MAPPRKTITQYEQEATRLENGCLIHPSCRVARKIYYMRHPETLDQHYICHTCDEPFCIEDSHHFPGSPTDNIRDSVAKGRHSCFANVKLAQAASPFGTDKWDSSKRDFKDA